MKPSNSIVNFFAYVSFFPQLVAGPIERAASLLPQFSLKRKFDEKLAISGMKLILWGLFKKIVIADNCGVLVNEIFSNYENLPASTLILGSILFAFQIYGDFSGYSDIAIGTSRLFGFKLMRNFAYPYFSRDIAEFWRRWHISLSTWFRDYLYIPLGGSRVGNKVVLIRNVFIIFLVSGFWHGANWTFIFWGAINALLYIPLLLRNKNRSNLGTISEGRLFPTFNELYNIIFTFGMTCIAWIFFRAQSIQEAISYLKRITKLTFELPNNQILIMCFGILTFVLIEWASRESEIIKPFAVKGKLKRWTAYTCTLLSLFLFSPEAPSVFIYFQF